jgi:hypothetical protein
VYRVTIPSHTPSNSTFELATCMPALMCSVLVGRVAVPVLCVGLCDG